MRCTLLLVILSTACSSETSPATVSDSGDADGGCRGAFVVDFCAHGSPGRACADESVTPNCGMGTVSCPTGTIFRKTCACFAGDGIAAGAACQTDASTSDATNDGAD